MPQEKGNNLGFLNGQGEQVDLQGIDHVQVAQLGDKDLLLVFGFLSMSPVALTTVASSTTTLAPKTAAESSVKVQPPNPGSSCCHGVFQRKNS